MALKSIYKRSRNPMEGMGSLPAGNPSMAQGYRSRFPRQRWRPTSPQPQPHTPYKAPIPGRKLKRRGAAVIDANPYRTSLKALQRGTNVPIRLIGGEVRGHGASKRSRQEKREQERARMEQIALDNAAGGGGGRGEPEAGTPEWVQWKRDERKRAIAQKEREVKGLDWLGGDSDTSLAEAFRQRIID
jgi:hypothetical protein